MTHFTKDRYANVEGYYAGYKFRQKSDNKAFNLTATQVKKLKDAVEKVRIPYMTRYFKTGAYRGCMVVWYNLKNDTEEAKTSLGVALAAALNSTLLQTREDQISVSEYRSTDVTAFVFEVVLPKVKLYESAMDSVREAVIAMVFRNENPALGKGSKQSKGIRIELRNALRAYGVWVRTHIVFDETDLNKLCEDYSAEAARRLKAKSDFAAKKIIEVQDGDGIYKIMLKSRVDPFITPEVIIETPNAVDACRTYRKLLALGHLMDKDSRYELERLAKMTLAALDTLQG